MTHQQVKDMLWLLLVSKRELPYTSQREQWNRIQAAVRDEIKYNVYEEPITDDTGRPLDLYTGTYQD